MADGFGLIADRSLNTPANEYYYSTQYFISKEIVFTKPLHKAVEVERVILNYKKALTSLYERMPKTKFPPRLSETYRDCMD